MPVFMGQRRSQGDASWRRFLKVAAEMGEQTGSGRLFQRDRAQE